MASYTSKRKKKMENRMIGRLVREEGSPKYLQNPTMPLEKDTLRCNEELNEGRLHRQHLRDVTEPLTWREERESRHVGR